MKLLIPNVGELVLETVILDLNGTIAVRGEVLPGVKDRIEQVQKLGLRLVLFSGDTRGNAMAIAKELGVELVSAGTGEEKRTAALGLNPDTCVTIGNGLIDVPLFKTVKLSIAVIQAEGAHGKVIAVADVVVLSVLDALDLLLNPSSLIATLRP